MVAKIFKKFTFKSSVRSIVNESCYCSNTFAVTSLLIARVLHPSLIPQLRNLNICIPCLSNIPLSHVQIIRGNFYANHSCSLSRTYTSTQEPE